MRCTITHSAGHWFVKVGDKWEPLRWHNGQSSREWEFRERKKVMDFDRKGNFYKVHPFTPTDAVLFSTFGLKMYNEPKRMFVNKIWV